MVKFFFDAVQSIVGKGENACYQHIFQHSVFQCFFGKGLMGQEELFVTLLCSGWTNFCPKSNSVNHLGRDPAVCMYFASYQKLQF